MSQQEQRRTRLREGADSLAADTRGQLAEAFVASVSDGSTQVSVTWICERAGVARSTFYTHFSSVEELAGFVVTAELERFVQEGRQPSGTGDGSDRSQLTRMVEGVLFHRDLVRHAVSVASKPIVQEWTATWLSTILPLSSGSSSDEPQAPHSILLRDMCCAGVAQGILAWMDDPNGIAGEELVELIGALLATGFRTDASESRRV